MHLDVGSLLSALIGAAAALLGVLVTQRSERRKAHDDRIWDKRTSAYAVLLQWYRGQEEILARSGPGMTAEDRLALQENIPLDVFAEVWLYASSDVLDGYRHYTGARADLGQFEHHRPRPSDSDVAALQEWQLAFTDVRVSTGEVLAAAERAMAREIRG